MGYFSIMLLFASPAPLPELRPLNEMRASISDHGARLDLHVLEAACGLLGGTSAWVMRHNDDCCQIINLPGAAIEIGNSLNALLAQAATHLRQQPALMMRWNEDTLICASLSVQPEADGCNYMMCILFNGQLRWSERLAGVLDGLRCSLHAMISQQISKQRLDALLTTEKQPVACACCHRIQTSEHGWMHWDDLHFLQSGRASSHTYCGKCALELYGDLLQGTQA
jgi:hypothetical protein